MIKRNIGIVDPLIICANLFTQETTNMYGVNQFKTKADQIEEYLAGLKDHTKKHHSK